MRNSSETSAVLSHGTISCLAFYKVRFGNFVDLFSLWLSPAVNGFMTYLLLVRLFQRNH